MQALHQLLLGFHGPFPYLSASPQQHSMGSAQERPANCSSYAHVTTCLRPGEGAGRRGDHVLCVGAPAHDKVAEKIDASCWFLHGVACMHLRCRVRRQAELVLDSAHARVQNWVHGEARYAPAAELPQARTPTTWPSGIGDSVLQTTTESATSLREIEGDATAKLRSRRS